MTVDWVSLVIVVGAYFATRASKLSLRGQNGINAAAMFAVVGWRAYSLGLNLQSTNTFITIGAAVLGVIYVARAARSG